MVYGQEFGVFVLGVLWLTVVDGWGRDPPSAFGISPRKGGRGEGGEIPAASAGMTEMGAGVGPRLRGGDFGLGGSGTPPLSLRDISPRKGGRGDPRGRG